MGNLIQPVPTKNLIRFDFIDHLGLRPVAFVR